MRVNGLTDKMPNVILGEATFIKSSVTPTKAGRSHLGTNLDEPIGDDATSTLFQPAPAWSFGPTLSRHQYRNGGNQRSIKNCR